MPPFSVSSRRALLGRHFQLTPILALKWPMSERLYYADPFLASFASRVADIREVSRAHNQILWQIALERTAFYPTSGGQPNDMGELKARAPSGAVLDAPVLNVEEDEAGEIWHTTTKPLAAGTVVQGEIDWLRRRDHMQQHSGQHLLSAIFDREAGAHTVSFHLGRAVSTIDLEVEKLAAEDLERVERIANEVVAEDHAVRMRSVSRCEAEGLLASGGLRKLPERTGTIRLIEIEGVDLNACGGTHVRSTGQIGTLSIRGTERVSSGLRVEFLCGLRASEAAHLDLVTLAKASQKLSGKRIQIPEMLDRLLGENKALHKERQKLWGELADYQAAVLAIQEPIEDGLRIVKRAFADRGGEYLRILASRMTSSLPQTCVLLAATAEQPVKIVMASSRDLAIDCGSVLRGALGELGGRGGGGPTMAQGELSSSQVDALFSRVGAELDLQYRERR